MVLPIALLVSEKKLHWNAQLLFKLFSIYAYIYLSILFNKHLLCIFYVISEMLTNKNPKINNLWSWKVLCPSKMSNKGTNGIIHWGEWYCSVAGVNMTFYESIQNFSATLSNKYKVNTKMYKTNKVSREWEFIDLAFAALELPPLDISGRETLVSSSYCTSHAF